MERQPRWLLSGRTRQRGCRQLLQEGVECFGPSARGARGGGDRLGFCHPVNVLTLVLLAGKSEPGGTGRLPSSAVVQAFKWMHSIQSQPQGLSAHWFLVSFELNIYAKV